MKRSWVISFLIVVCLLAVVGPGFAAKRDIYVGDIINLKLTTTVLTPQEIKQKFKEQGFEIVKLKETAAGYQVAVRSFEVGEKTVEFDGQTVKLKVSSIVEATNRSQIYKSELAFKKPAASFPWRYLAIGLLVLLVVSSLGAIIWKFISKRQEYNLTPKENFDQQVNQLTLDSENYFVKLTLAVKRYLEERFDCQISGKTSAEVVEEMGKVKFLSQYQAELEAWFNQTAVYKYTPQQADEETKQQSKQELIELVDSIQAEYEAESKLKTS